ARFPLNFSGQNVDCAIARTTSIASDTLNRTAQLDGFAPAIPVPGWFGEETQGGAITVMDLDGNGLRELVIFHIHHPAGDNQGYSRIGWNVDASANVMGGWTDPIPVPGWFGQESQGAGVAVTDIDGNGKPELIIFHIDHADGGNAAYYRIGWDLDPDG